ncbi:condensin complex subunit 2 [Uranotaenia lowii]|uniref:condensin complex subunit 2 n=1 Tax=Uranotaenia lowii TaxID=190385 RepID=UPI002479668B|nr:condensin complex subunit 2 [Uranotaenia lowii]
MTPVAVMESPLRRSDASRLFRTPRTPATEEVNDDEAERRIRRSAASLDESTVAGGNTVEDNENIKMCLQLYSDNKLSKDNAWSVTIIDTFAKLMSRHSNTMQNFQVAGSTLEASTKVYGLRVDSVHTDVMRMCSELTRQSARAMDNNREAEEDDGDDGANKENDASIAGGSGEGAGTQDQPKPKKKRAKKQVSTVTKNKESINATLDTNPFTDPFFAKLNSVVGDVNSSSRLMQNLIPTENGELKLRMDYAFWDASDSLELDLDVEEDYEDCSALTTITLYSVTRANKLHQTREGYVITDAPAEEEDNDEDQLKDTQDPQIRDADMPLDRSALDVRFDMDADVEPIPVGDAYIIDYASTDALGGPDNDDDFNEDDQLALQNCRGLKRKTVVIEDMRPIDSSSANLEYSYRALDTISQFWAGPSHWKFKRSRNLRGLSLALSTVSGSDAKASKPKDKITKKKKRFEGDTLDDIISVGEEFFPPYSQTRPVKNITHLKSLICRKWDAKKLKLPTDFHLERNRFDVNQFSRGLKVKDVDAAPEPDVPADDYDYDNPVDPNYCSRVGNEIADSVADDAGTLGGGDDHHHFDDISRDGDGPSGAPTLNTSADFIPTEFQGAPDKVAKIHIAYAKTAKVVDMKQLKTCCWRLITEQHTANADPNVSGSSTTEPSEGKAKFSTIYRELPNILTKTMSENISKSLAFYSVLHLTNERSLRLVRQDDLKDFTILPPA